MADQQTLAKKPFSPLNALKGILVGMANIIPGVSGGTIAVITGLYDEVVDAFGNFFTGEGGWRRNLFFLIPVVAGVLVGNVALARLLGFLFDNAPRPTNYGFIGLILGSTPYLVRRVGARSISLRHLVLFALGLFLVLWMGLTPRPETSPPITDIDFLSGALVFGAAFLGSIAMIIPGVSGSFLLLLIGMYSTLQNGFSTLNGPVITIFVLGTITGVVLASKAISALLRRFHGSTYAVVIGLVVGSVVSIYPGMGAGIEIVWDLGAFLVGTLMSIFLGRGSRRTYDVRIRTSRSL
ncbi:MAG: DUF368 domain-containing protein [Spirochaetota bacterium]